MHKTIVFAPFSNSTEKKLFESYESIAKSNADEVLLRDISCQKRELSIDFYKKVIKLLKDNNKKIILNTPLIIRQKDKVFDKFNNKVDYVELNNLGYFHNIKNSSIILGPHLKLYNWQDSKIFDNTKFDRFVVPYRLTKYQTQDLLKNIKQQSEIFVFGLEQIAISWNCFLAPFFEKNRFNCQKICYKYKNGLNISSINKIPLFKTMGTEVFSQKPYSILNEINYLKERGVKYYRINPHVVFEDDELTMRINELKDIIDGKKSFENIWWLDKCNGTFYKNTPGYEYVGVKG